MEKEVDIFRLKKKSPEKLVDMLYRGEINSALISPLLTGTSSLSKVLRPNHTRNQSFYEFIKNVQSKRVDVMADNRTVECLENIFKLRKYFIRDIESWDKKGYNQDKQLIGLVQHLFTKYKVPKFMDYIWFKPYIDRSLTGSSLNYHHDLYIWLAQGHSIREFETGPIRLSKKEAPLFYTAPDDYTIDEAFKWAQVIAMGGDEKIVKGILGTQHLSGFRNFIGVGADQDKLFWDHVLHFFVSQPMMDNTMIGPLCDYISHKRGQDRYRTVWYPLEKKYIRVYDNPPFEIKGRTIQSLIRGMEEWHLETQSTKKGRALLVWDAIPLPDFQISYGKDDKKVTYTIKQITTEKELKAEGRRMHHCVGSYASSCASGHCSIWSMEETKFFGALSKSLLTIELQKDKTISQVRGFGNRTSNKEEDRVMGEWAAKEGLKFSRWIR